MIWIVFFLGLPREGRNAVNLLAYFLKDWFFVTSVIVINESCSLFLDYFPPTKFNAWFNLFLY